MPLRSVFPLVAVALIVGTAGCQKKPEKDLAPVASTVKPARAATSKAVKAELDAGASTVQLTMEAPLERIYGVVKSGTTGELFVDPADVRQTSGLVKVNLQHLVLTQQKRESEDGQFGQREKKDLQNEHARNWLEISDDTPEKDRRENEIVQFKITQVADVSANDVTKLPGATREVTATVTGDFILHRRQVEKTAKMRIVFEYEGGRAKGVHMTTVEPFIVDLEQHDVRPRKAFGVLADATLATLGKKVDKQPKVTLDLRARLGK
jgi:hypothetical protein